LNGDMDEFNSKLQEAKANITLAHNNQTETIQKQISEEESNIDLLFIHAQDTLMTIMSEYNLVTMIGKSHQELLNEIEKLKNK
ncbi:MAG: PTS lactose/cellobiose transporter subunit IIA, partial [Staphylococcus equorum]|nr:PTS lactose/cellobiose transporter subunit IIA [Staphylococcus equorum]